MIDNKFNSFSVWGFYFVFPSSLFFFFCQSMLSCFPFSSCSCSFSPSSSTFLFLPFLSSAFFPLSTSLSFTPLKVDPLLELHAAVWCLIRVLQTQLRCSARALHVPNYWSVSPARTQFLKPSTTPNKTQLFFLSFQTLKLFFKQTTQESEAFATSDIWYHKKKSPESNTSHLFSPWLLLLPDTKDVCSSSSSSNLG